MSSNRRKPQPNLGKPSEGGSFEAERKPTSEQTKPLGGGLSITAERELGTVGGIKSTAKLTVGVDDLIGQQGIDIEIDATNQTAGFGVGIGSTKGKLGVNIGGKVGYDEDGNLSVKGAEVGINVGGFGGSASIDEDEGIRGSISAAGAKIEIGIRPDGKKIVSLCYGVPGGELCVTFEPDEDIETPKPPTPTPVPPPPTPTEPNGIDLPDTDAEGWVSYTELIKSYGFNSKNQVVMFDSAEIKRDVTNIVKNRASYGSKIPFTSNINSNNSVYSPSLSVPVGTTCPSELLFVRKYDDSGTISFPVLTRYINFRSNKVCFYGFVKNIKKFISDYNASRGENHVIT